MIRVVTLNIWNRQGPWGRRLALIREGLAALGPDLVGLQEVLCLPGAGPHQAEEIAAATGHHVVYGEAWKVMGGPLSFGNALLSRWPILEHQVIDLPIDDGAEGRAMIYAVCDAPGGRLPVYVTHLSWELHQAHSRARQVRAIDDHAQAHLEKGMLPAILMGDLNAEPDSDEMRFLRGLTALGGRGTYWADCFGLVGQGPGYTFARDNGFAAELGEPSRRIDYVFVRGPDRAHRGEPLAARVVLEQPREGVWPSDHYGVYAEISD
jgi:endonuclease/exonuclease/phosphatase family metal-dependent hydrolase